MSNRLGTSGYMSMHCTLLTYCACFSLVSHVIICAMPEVAKAIILRVINFPRHDHKCNYQRCSMDSKITPGLGMPVMASTKTDISRTETGMFSSQRDFE